MSQWCAQLELVGALNPSNQELVWTVGTIVVLEEALLAARDGPSAPCKCLIVEAGVGERPVQVFFHQHVPSVLVVTSDPVGPFIVVGRSKDGCLVDP